MAAAAPSKRSAAIHGRGEKPPPMGGGAGRSVIGAEKAGAEMGAAASGAAGADGFRRVGRFENGSIAAR